MGFCHTIIFFSINGSVTPNSTDILITCQSTDSFIDGNTDCVKEAVGLSFSLQNI